MLVIFKAGRNDSIITNIDKRIAVLNPADRSFIEFGKPVDVMIQKILFHHRADDPLKLDTCNPRSFVLGVVKPHHRLIKHKGFHSHGVGTETRAYVDAHTSIKMLVPGILNLGIYTAQVEAEEAFVPGECYVSTLSTDNRNRDPVVRRIVGVPDISSLEYVVRAPAPSAAKDAVNI